jgi:hypothetical protein
MEDLASKAIRVRHSRNTASQGAKRKSQLPLDDWLKQGQLHRLKLIKGGA